MFMFVSHNGKFGNKSISKLHSIYSILAIKKFVIYIKNETRRITEFLKVRQGSIFESVGRSFATDGLLSHTCNHLRDVDEGT